MPPVHVYCSDVLCLDLDGVLHPARDAIHLSSSSSMAPGPILAAQLRAQGRLVWLPQLEAVMAHNPCTAILVHSTWRRKFSTPTIAGLLAPLTSRVIVPPSFAVDLQAPAPEFIRQSLDWMNGEREAAGASALGFDDLLVLDDREEFFRGDPELMARLLKSDPNAGLRDGELQRHLTDWLINRLVEAADTPCVAASRASFG